MTALNFYNVMAFIWHELGASISHFTPHCVNFEIHKSIMLHLFHFHLASAFYLWHACVRIIPFSKISIDCVTAQERRVEHVIYSNLMFNDTIYSIHILDFGIIYATMTCACWCVWGVNALALAPAHSVPLARFIVACVAAMRIVRRFSFSLFIHIRIILFSDSLII